MFIFKTKFTNIIINYNNLLNKLHKVNEHFILKLIKYQFLKMIIKIAEQNDKISFI